MQAVHHKLGLQPLHTVSAVFVVLDIGCYLASVSSKWKCGAVKKTKACMNCLLQCRVELKNKSILTRLDLRLLGHNLKEHIMDASSWNALGIWWSCHQEASLQLGVFMKFSLVHCVSVGFALCKQNNPSFSTSDVQLQTFSRCFHEEEVHYQSEKMNWWKWVTDYLRNLSDFDLSWCLGCWQRGSFSFSAE